MTAAHTRINHLGQTVSAVPGEPGTVRAGRPDLVVLHNPNLADPFSPFGEHDDDEDDYSGCYCLVGRPHTCEADSSDLDHDRDYD